MQANHFDTISRLFANRKTRRQALAGSAGLAAAALTAPRLLAQDGTPEASTSTVDPSDPHPSADEATHDPEFLFVQPFEAGAWAPKAGEDGVYTLTLTGASANTVYFSDRPERIFGLAPTGPFLDNLGFTPTNPPNAALVARRADGSDQEVLVIELLNPAYDGETLTYDAKVLADYGEPGLTAAARTQMDYELPESFAEGSLFIDDCSDGEGACYNIVNGDQQDIGSITVGNCYHFPACEPCNDDWNGAQWGKACAEQYPDQCSYGSIGDIPGISWDCYVHI